MTPRRFGKTMSVGMFVAAYLYSVENAEICIFSTGRRASQKLLELIKSLIEKLPNGRERILKFNQEILNVSNFDGSPGASKLSSFPSNAKTLRGVGGNLVIMEEVSKSHHHSLSLQCPWGEDITHNLSNECIEVSTLNIRYFLHFPVGTYRI